MSKACKRWEVNGPVKYIGVIRQKQITGAINNEAKVSGMESDVASGAAVDLDVAKRIGI